MSRQLEHRITARTWARLERLLRAEHGNGRLVRISRLDGGSAYNAPGEFDVDFIPEAGDAINYRVRLVAHATAAEWNRFPGKVPS